MTKEGVAVKDLCRRTAIKYHCYICSGFNRAERKSCDMVDCELWEYRSGRIPAERTAIQRNEAITAYCTGCCGESYAEKKHCPQDCPLFPFRMHRADKSIEITT